MNFKHVMGAKLTLDSGDTIMLERIGKGMFHTCYVDNQTSVVYSFTIERETGSDYSKEILSHCDSNPHIPPVEYIGTMDGEDRRVYRMPKYQPMRAAEHKDAWRFLKMLAQAKDDAWRAILAEQVNTHKMRLTDIGYLVNIRVCELMDAPGVPTELKDALEALKDEAMNFGSDYVFEFSKRNCMVDANGTLILLDVLFSLESTEQIRIAQQKKHRGW